MSQIKPTAADYDKKLKELQELEALIRMKEGLPHLYGYPWYSWALRIFESPRQEILLTAANQIGKSSTAIRKNIELATNPSLWPKFWPKLRPGQVPSPFWYMYPTLQVASESVSEKWIKEFLPRNEYKNHPQYGWKEEWHKSEIYAIHFNTGVSIIFKSMSQKVADLQTSSVYHLTCDEELPVELLPELTARTFATSGKMLFVFTATRGDPHWRKAMEPTSSEEETHVDALKIQVSLYDCLKYDDGTESPWTKDKIARVVSSCSSEKEVLRRVYGKFVLAEGLMYEGFSLEKNQSDAHPLPKDWHVFAGVDPGSGGKSGHPAAIVFLATNPTYSEARVFRAWRGDGVSTTSQDILNKFRELKATTNPVAQVYDFAAKDFFMIASRAGEAFSPADKGRDRGVALLNTLFKSGMLKIQRGDSELEKLVTEICSLSVNTKKTVAQDDLCFHGSTLIATQRGEMPIKDVSIGDMVLTSKGFRSVLAKTISIGEMIDVDICGVKTWVTPNHKYKMIKKEKPISQATKTDLCQILSLPEKQRLLYSGVLNTGDTQTQKKGTCNNITTRLVSLSIKGLSHSIENCINFMLAKFRQIMLFIILMVIRLTIRLKILSAFVKESICKIMQANQIALKLQEKISKLSAPKPLRGIKVKLPKIFMFGLPRKAGKILSSLKKSVKCVGSRILLYLTQVQDQSFVQTNVRQKTGEISARIESRKIVVCVENHLAQAYSAVQKPALLRAHINLGKNKKTGLVYNITVDDAHEYFANDVLVANCDALRYVAMSVPWDFSSMQMTDEQKEKVGIKVEKPRLLTESERRKEWFLSTGENKPETIEDQIDEWNSLF